MMCIWKEHSVLRWGIDFSKGEQYVANLLRGFVLKPELYCQVLVVAMKVEEAKLELNYSRISRC